jgi:hypothetical protein
MALTITCYFTLRGSGLSMNSYACLLKNPRRGIVEAMRWPSKKEFLCGLPKMEME